MAGANGNGEIPLTGDPRVDAALRRLHERNDARFRDLEDAMLVQAHLEKRQTRRLDDHEGWLADLQALEARHHRILGGHQFVWERHQEIAAAHYQWVKRHEEWLANHEAAMAEHAIRMREFDIECRRSKPSSTR